MIRQTAAVLLVAGLLAVPLPSVASVSTTGAGSSRQTGAPPVFSYFMLLESGGHISLNAGGSLLCNVC